MGHGKIVLDKFGMGTAFTQSLLLETKFHMPPQRMGEVYDHSCRAALQALDTVPEEDFGKSLDRMGQLGGFALFDTTVPGLFYAQHQPGGTFFYLPLKPELARQDH